MNQLTKIALVWELYGQGMPKTHIVQRLNLHRETVRIWIIGILQSKFGLTGFLDNYQNAKKGQRKKRKVDGLLKVQIWKLREENRGCCGQKIQRYLKDTY